MTLDQFGFYKVKGVSPAISPKPLTKRKLEVFTLDGGDSNDVLVQAPNVQMESCLFIAASSIRGTKKQKRRFICTWPGCIAAVDQAANLKTHYRTHTGEKPFQCQFQGCGAAFSQSGGLNKHHRTHTGEKPFRCQHEGCGAAFSQSGSLKQHHRTHSGEKPFHCQHEGCGAAFSESGHLNRHQRTHTGEKPFRCQQEGCGAAFRDSGGLKKHHRTHSGEKPFHCQHEGCYAAFSQSGHLTNHARMHTGEKPFRCQYQGCGAAFSRSCRLTIHARIHTGAKPFVCEHCNHQFAHKSTLTKHVQCHEEQKSYTFACPMQDYGTQLSLDGDIGCSIRCKTQRDLDYHIERNHTTEGIGRKLHSETKLAAFFDKHTIVYDRDWMNRISFKGCNSIERGAIYARPDFFLKDESAKLGVLLFVGNDEMQHRYYECDSARVHNIVQALDQTREFKDIPIVYVRFNPHSYWRDGVLYNHSLDNGHEILLKTIRSISREEIRPGLNLIYVHYDATEGDLDIYREVESNNFAALHKPCVMRVV